MVVHLGAADRGEEHLARSRGSLEQLVDTAREAGGRIAVENLPPDNLGGSVAEIRRVLDGLDPAVVGFCLDTGHAMLGQDDMCDYIRAFGDRLLGIHWHSNDCETDAHLCPGVDETAWDGFFAALDEVGYDSPVTVEAVPPETTPLREAVQELQTALRERRAPRFA